MHYAIRHITRFRYSEPVRENVTEVRMQPRTEGSQRCVSFTLSVLPRAVLSSYQDHLGNTVHHFDLPAAHSQLTLTAEALVEVQPFDPLPAALPAGAWAEQDCLAGDADVWEFLQPSRYTHPSPLLHALADELQLARRDDPLTVLRTLTQRIFETFAYVPMSTGVESPIDDAIAARRGVCQDFTHIMLALVRTLGIPCRYVSGYLFHRTEDHDRSAEDATHAWMEALLPGLGWVGFDPTNNLVAASRHIRVAVGRDYADVPPTRGVYKGAGEETLTVGVSVVPAEAPQVAAEDLMPPEPAWSPPKPDEEAAWMPQQ
jgi:transglutaminase-like putative cysteine protease